MFIQMKQTLMLISKFFVQIFFQFIFGRLEVWRIAVTFDLLRTWQWGLQESFETLENEVSTLLVRYIRVIANQKRRPQFKILVLIVVECNVEIMTKCNRIQPIRYTLRAPAWN